MSISVADLLLNSLSSDQKTRENSTRFLEQAASQNFGAYLQLLTEELAKDANSVYVRMAAGVAFKNALVCRGSNERTTKIQRWMNIDSSIKRKTKELLLTCLSAADPRIGSALAQAIEGVAFIELPGKEWPELMPFLFNSVLSASTSASLKRASLETIGFICEEIQPDVFAEISDQVLGAVLGGLQQKADDPLRVTAATALLNSLDFIASSGFNDSSKRDFIMSVICDCTISGNDRLVVVVLECLIRIFQLFYDLMQPYFETGILPISLRLLNSTSDPDVLLQAIELWSTICEIEIALEEDPERAGVCCLYARKSIPHILPKILQLLPAASDEALEECDEDEWNPSMAAATCLSLWAECCGNELLKDGKIYAFINQNIESPTTRFRDAAIMAIGCVLEGPSDDTLSQLLNAALPMLKQCVVNEKASPAIRDSAAWALGRVCSLHAAELRSAEWEAIVRVLIDGLSASSRIASHCAWALQSLALAVSDSDESTGNPLTPFLEAVVSALFAAISCHSASTSSNVQTLCYGALCSCIETSAEQSNVLVITICDKVLQELANFLDRSSPIGGREVSGRVANLSLLLQATTKRLHRNQVEERSDRLMHVFLTFLTPPTSPTATASFPSEQANFYEDILFALGSVASVLDSTFSRFIPFLFPVLQQHLKSYQASSLCSAAIGVLGDACRAARSAVKPFITGILEVLAALIQAPDINRTLISPIVSCFGDIALALDTDYQPFVGTTMSLLTLASGRFLRSPTSLADPAAALDDDFQTDLRIALLETLTCLLQAMKSKPAAINELVPLLPSIVTFVRQVKEQRSAATDQVHHAAIALLGDAADTMRDLGRDVFLSPSNAWIRDYIQSQLQSSRSTSLRKIAQWTMNVFLTAYYRE